MANKKVNAWILYWEYDGNGSLPIAENGEVVAILPLRQTQRVKTTLERLYLERIATTPEELILWRGGHSCYQVQPDAFVHGRPYSDGFRCGGEPALVARRVENLVAVSSYEITWDEVGYQHHDTDWCRSIFRVDNCGEAGKAPHRIKKTWTASPNDQWPCI